LGITLEGPNPIVDVDESNDLDYHPPNSNDSADEDKGNGLKDGCGEDMMLINKLNEKFHQLLMNRVGQIFQEDRTLLDTNSLKTRTQVPVAL
jgi:hypothetical protein